MEQELVWHGGSVCNLSTWEIKAQGLLGVLVLGEAPIQRKKKHKIEVRA